MKLTDLDPRWLVDDGQRVGFIFRCPTRPKDRWQSCFVASPARRQQWELFREAMTPAEQAESGGNVQGCSQGTHWTIAGGIEAADFASLSVTPSLDGSAGGNWHGYITNGQIVGGI